MPMKFHIVVFWVVTRCSVVVGYRRFGGPFCLHLRGEVNAVTTQKTKTWLMKFAEKKQLFNFIRIVMWSNSPD